MVSVGFCHAPPPTHFLAIIRWLEASLTHYETHKNGDLSGGKFTNSIALQFLLASFFFTPHTLRNTAVHGCVGAGVVDNNEWRMQPKVDEGDGVGGQDGLEC